MRLFAYSMCFVLALVMVPGCGGKKKTAAPKTDTAKTNPAANAGADAGKSKMANRPKQEYTKNGHPIPSVGSMGGGGAMTGGSGPEVGAKSNQNTSQASNNASSSSSFTATGLANGLFPQAGSSTYTSVYSENPSQIGGGLFPQRGTSGGSTTSTGSMSSTSTTRPAASNSGNTVASSDEPEEEKVVASGNGEFYDFASAAFESGDGEKAMNYVYAHLLATEDALDDYPMKWHASVKRPRVALRWGLGIVRGGSVDGRAPVIGEPVADDEEGAAADPEQLNLGTGSSLGSGSSDSGPSIYERVDTNTPTGLLLYYTGSVGEKLVNTFDSRRQKGTYYGRILKGMPEVLPAERPESETTAAAEPAASPARGGSAFARNRKNRVIPSVGSSGGGAPGGAGAPPTSDNSRSNAGGGGGGGATARTSSSLVTRWGGTASDNPDGDVIGELTPGLIGLGVGSKEELMRRAAENGVDCLLVIQINGMKRKETIYSNTKVRWVDMNTGKDLVKTSSMSNIDVMKKLSSGKDIVASKLDSFFSDDLVDALTASKMPNINEDAVIRRVEGIVDAAEYPMRDAVEVLWFHREGLLPETDAIRALDSLLDGIGSAIITGSSKKRMDVISRLVE